MKNQTINKPQKRQSKINVRHIYWLIKKVRPSISKKSIQGVINETENNLSHSAFFNFCLPSILW